MNRILLVEDEHDIADMLHMFFKMHGYAFFHAGDGEEALMLASRVLPHVIILDISLPDTDGYSLAVKLRWRPRTAHIPIIFATKWGGRDRRLAGLELGADAYLTKPYDVQELLLRVQNSIAQSASQRFTDLRTGLPAVFTARPWLEQAHSDPALAVIEIALEHATPFQVVYGNRAAAEVHAALGTLLLDVVNQRGHPDDFIGYLDEDQFVILSSADRASAIADQITNVFNNLVPRFYAQTDVQRGYIPVGDEIFPLMQVACRVTFGQAQHDIP